MTRNPCLPTVLLHVCVNVCHKGGALPVVNSEVCRRGLSGPTKHVPAQTKMQNHSEENQ